MFNAFLSCRHRHCLGMILRVLSNNNKETKQRHNSSVQCIYWTWQTNITHGLIYSSYKTLIFFLCAIIVFILKNGCIQWFMFYFRSLFRLFSLFWLKADKSKRIKQQRPLTQLTHTFSHTFKNKACTLGFLSSSSSRNDEELLRSIVIFYPLGQ